MRKKLILLGILISAVFINGCEQFIYNSSYNVSVYNNTNDMYMTELYFRTYDYGNHGWSRNQVYYDLEPFESFNMLLDAGTYDFEIVLEDDEYIYTIHEEYVDIYNDMVLDVCYDCYLKGSLNKVVKKEKKESGKERNTERTSARQL